MNAVKSLDPFIGWHTEREREMNTQNFINEYSDQSEEFGYIRVYSMVMNRQSLFFLGTVTAPTIMAVFVFNATT